MARKTRLQYKPQYMPRASDVIVRRMGTNEIIDIKPSLEDKDLYNYLFKSKSRRRREWFLIGAK